MTNFKERLKEDIEGKEKWFRKSPLRKPRKVHVQSQMDGYLYELHLDKAKLKGYEQAEKDFEKIIEKVLNQYQGEINSHIGQFGLGENRDIDPREKSLMLTIPTVLKERFLKELKTTHLEHKEAKK